MGTVLQLLKMDLGISHSSRDTFFFTLLEASESELKQKGIVLNLENAADQMLLSDFTSWHYRKRTEDVPLSRNLDFRIKNRIVKSRCENYVG